jgi:DnaJ-class molecular chaperone
MHQVSLYEFQDAIESLDLLSLTSRESVRKKYLKLSKLYHPDMPTGDTKKFQEIQKAYEIVTEYMNNFRFVFDEDEFKRQNPILVSAFNNLWIDC